MIFVYSYFQYFFQISKTKIVFDWTKFISLWLALFRTTLRDDLSCIMISFQQFAGFFNFFTFLVLYYNNSKINEMNKQIVKRYSLTAQNIKGNRFVEPKHKLEPKVLHFNENEEKYQTSKISDAKISYLSSKSDIQSKPSETTINVQQRLADFKKYLHKHSQIVSPQETPILSLKVKISSQEQSQVKRKLENIRMKAQSKLQELKETIKNHQKVKAEIIAKSDTRKNSLRVSNIL